MKWGKKMEIKQLEYVIMAAEMGSFNKASEYLYTTQSSVSKVIRSLEEELGYRIFKRNGNGVMLTDAGRILYDQSRQIMMMLRKFAAYSELEDKTCFHIATVVSNYIASHFAGFVREHDSQEYCLKMWEGSISQVVELVEQGEAEIGFLYLGDRQRDSFCTMLERKGLCFEKIMPARVILNVGPHHPLYEKESVTPALMQKLRYVRYREDSFSRGYHLQQLEKDLHLEKCLAHAVEVDSDYALINILATTDCGYLCYGGLEMEEQGIQGIRSISIDCEQREGVSLGYIRKKSDELSEDAKEFLLSLCRIS